MKKKDNNDELQYTIEAYLGSLKESPSHDWTKSVIKISWNNNSPTVDVRNINLTNNIIGKGISLSNEEADKLVSILLENDYGTLEELERAIDKKRKIFTPSGDTESLVDDVFLPISLSMDDD